MSTLPNGLKPFKFHAVDLPVLANGTKEAKTECIFCNHPNSKFHINVETGQYDCKHCGTSGNHYSFLAEIHRQALEKTTDADYKELAELRPGIPWRLFKEKQLAKCDRFREPRWLIPVENLRGTMVNLQVWVPGGPVLNTDGLPVYLGHVKGGFKPTGPVIVCEGPWDCYALEYLRRKAAKRVNIIYAPGSGTFKADWRDFLNNREVYIAYDNDNSGSRGAERAANTLRGHASSVSILFWPEGVADGWDLRDEVNYQVNEEKRTDYPTMWEELFMLFDHVTTSPGNVVHVSVDVDLPKNVTVKQIIKGYSKYYHIDDRFKNAIKMALATTISVYIPGDPLWFFLVAPPGFGKTLTINPFIASPLCIFKSSLTPKSLVSGWSDGAGDPSLIPQLKGKCLVLKDYTEIMTMSQDEREEMYGILRGAYDGYVEKSFGNGLCRRYTDTYFSMLAAVTDAIHGDNRASLGERFLKFQIVDGSNYKQADHIRAALDAALMVEEANNHLRPLIASFTSEDFSAGAIPKPPVWFRDRIINMVQVIAMLRATIPIGRGDELLYRPTPEVGTRLAKQLQKTGQALALVDHSKTIKMDHYQLVEKAALDTAIGWNLDIFRTLMDYYPKPITKQTLDNEAQIASATSQRRLEGMRTMKIVTRKRLPQSGPGQPPHGWVVDSAVAKLWKAAKVGNH